MIILVYQEFWDICKLWKVIIKRYIGISKVNKTIEISHIAIITCFINLILLMSKVKFTMKYTNSRYVSITSNKMLNKYFCTYPEKDNPADHLNPVLKNMPNFLAEIDTREADK